MTLWQKDPLRALRRSVGKDKLLTAPEDLVLYGFDASSIRGRALAVMMAETTDDIRNTVNFAREEGFKIIPRGAGTGLSGGSVPVEGGIVISCERMDSILSIDVKEHFALVQPGVVTSMLQEAVAEHGLFYPPDPSSFSVSTIGGNVAENAGGLRCFKYGVTGHYVLGVEFVDANGQLRYTGALDDGDFQPELTPLMVGSEGTLGIFTRIALRLIDAPKKTVTVSAYFDDSDSAFIVVEQIISSGCVPSVLEYIDGKALSASAKHVGISYPDNAEAMLLIELDGSEEEASETLPIIRELTEKSCIEVNVAEEEVQRQQLWQLRRGISPSLIQLSTGKIHEDVAVPRSMLSELVLEIRRIEEKYDLEIPLYGHAGDGNLHAVVFYDAEDSRAGEIAREASKEIFRAAIDMGGTISGEHGIGYTKREFLPGQHSEAVLTLTRQVKRILDPDDLFNPGKILL